MSDRDPLLVLAELDRPVEPRAEFADELLASCLAALAEAPAPASRAWGLSGWGRARLALAAALLLLVLAGVATATYWELRSPEARNTPRSGLLTVISSGRPPARVAEIAVVGAQGTLQTVWRCPEDVFCGTLTSVAWSPDGRRLAMTLDEIGGTSGFVGLHIVDLRSGRDLHIPSLPIARIWRPQPHSVGAVLWKQATRRLGCGAPSELAWSPDSTRVAYVCPAAGPNAFDATQRTAIYVLRADGSGRHRVRTGTRSAFWPTWSPDGKRLAFATGPAPRVLTGQGAAKRTLHSSVYALALDGSSRLRVATNASGPSWSPDGTTIAYQSGCGGIRLVTPAGVDVTPGPASACPHIGRRGLPTWSPDGTLIAIGAFSETYLVGADGHRLRRATSASSAGVLGGGRPAWAPGNAAATLGSRLRRVGKGL